MGFSALFAIQLQSHLGTILGDVVHCNTAIVQAKGMFSLETVYAKSSKAFKTKPTAHFNGRLLI